jgi:hypothetical protein
MRLVKWVSVVAGSSVTLLVASAGIAQDDGLWDEFGNLIRFCGQGNVGARCQSDEDCDTIDPDGVCAMDVCTAGNVGEACQSNDDCNTIEPDGLCNDIELVNAVPDFDNPDVYAIANRFVDEKNLTTLYAGFDLDGLNFAAGYANRTETVSTENGGAGNEIRANFNWVAGVPTKVRQKEKRNHVGQTSYLAIALTFSSVERVMGGNDIFTTLFTISDPDRSGGLAVGVGYPIEVEGCSAKATVREPTKAKKAEDLSQIRLDTTWRLDCKDLPMPEGLACLDGSEDCPPAEQVSSQELLEFFEGSKDKIKARGQADVNYCESLIAGTPPPPSCQ